MTILHHSWESERNPPTNKEDMRERNFDEKVSLATWVLRWPLNIQNDFGVISEIIGMLRTACVGNALFGWIVNYNRTRACRKLNLRACYCQTTLAYNLSQLAGNKARWLNILKSDFPSPPLVLFPSSCTCMCTCRCQALSFSGSAHHRQVWSTKELWSRADVKAEGNKD